MELSQKEKIRLKKKYGPWAVVTGASSGIGLELSFQLASCGINLCICARSVPKLEELKQALTSTYSIEVLTVGADLSEANGLEKLKQSTKDVSVGLFIASAGFGTSGSLVKASIAEEINMVRLNVEGLLVSTHYFVQRFVAQKRGGIILLSSMVAFQGVPYAANYAATKAYVQSLAEGLHEEVKGEGVDVLAAAPGPVESGFGNRANMEMGMFLRPSQIGVPILKSLGRSTTVLPGFLTKFLVYSLSTVPRWGKVKIMKLVMGGMTKHQRVS